MTDKQPDRAEREAFEQAMNTARFFPRQIDFRKTASPSGKRDVLVNSLLESCWIGWQARAALAAPQPGYVLVPVEPTHDMLRALSGEWHPSRHQPERYAAMLAAARKAPQQEAPAVPDDPMDWKLPCDVTVGHGTIGKGVPLRTLVTRMKVLYEMATGKNADEVANRTPEQRAALFDAFRAQQAAPQPEAAAMTREQAHALRQGHEIAAADAYFEARPQIDSNDRRKVFEAGFQRGWDAALSAQGGV